MKLTREHPRIQALEAMIRSSVDAILDARGNGRSQTSESLLFLGNWHDAHPRLLIYDSILEPVDKVVYQVIRCAVNPSHGTAFPTYAEIASAANVSSDSTVARAMAILRMTRWLTLCVRARDERGRYRGNAYALHDEPLGFGETLILDPEYMRFIEEMRGHAHGRVREIAEATMSSLQADLDEGLDLEQATDPYETRRQSSEFVRHMVRGGTDPAATGLQAARCGGIRRELAIPLHARQSLVQDRLQNMETADPSQLQNLESVSRPQNSRPQNLGSSTTGSSSNNKTTTTTEAYRNVSLEPPSAGARENRSVTVTEPDGDYVMPPSLTDNECRLAIMSLHRVPPSRRQVVLDALAAKIAAVQDGADPIRQGPVAYLNGLIRRELEGKLWVPTPQPAPKTEAPTANDELRKVQGELVMAESTLRARREMLARLEPEVRAGLQQSLLPMEQEIARLRERYKELDNL